MNIISGVRFSGEFFHLHFGDFQKSKGGPYNSVGCYSEGRGFDSPVRQDSFVEIGHEIISTYR